MRTIAQMRRAFDLMLERAVSRTTRGGRLADMQATQDKIAESWIDAMQLHWALGVSNEMPFSAMMVDAQVMAIADGPTEVHCQTLARQLLRDVAPGDPLFGSGHLPTRAAAARAHVAARLEHEVAAL